MHKNYTGRLLQLQTHWSIRIQSIEKTCQAHWSKIFRLKKKTSSVFRWVWNFLFELVPRSSLESFPTGDAFPSPVPHRPVSSPSVRPSRFQQVLLCTNHLLHATLIYLVDFTRRVHRRTHVHCWEHLHTYVLTYIHTYIQTYLSPPRYTWYTIQSIYSTHIIHMYIHIHIHIYVYILIHLHIYIIYKYVSVDYVYNFLYISRRVYK